MTMLVINSENSGCNLTFLVSRNRCHNLNSMSRPQFDVATSFLLRRHLVMLSLQAGRDSKLLVCLFSCRDVEFRSQPGIFLNHFLYRPQKYVATIPSSYPVVTSFLSLNSCLQFFYFWSRPDCSALFWNICRDLDLML